MSTIRNQRRSLPALVLASLFVFSIQGQDGSPLPPGATPTLEGGIAPAPAATFVQVRSIEMRPDEKRPLLLKASDRNPYAKRTVADITESEEGTNAEELLIRKSLEQLRVTGRSQGPNGLRVLLGDIILEEGTLLPPLLVDQSENLSVIELNEDTVVLGWLDIETNEFTGKTMQVTYDLSPSVGYALHGQPTQGADPENLVERRMGVMHIDQARKRAESAVAASNPKPEIPREVYEAGQ